MDKDEGWTTHEVIGAEEYGWGRRSHPSSEDPFQLPSGELKSIREHNVRKAVQTSTLTLTMNNGDVYELGDIAKQYLVEEAIKNGLCQPKKWARDELVDMAVDETVKTSANRERLFMRFMMEDVLSVKENVQTRLLIPQYSLIPMKQAYVNIIMSLIPSYRGDPTTFGPDAKLNPQGS